jgi:hypothetical protein
MPRVTSASKFTASLTVREWIGLILFVSSAAVFFSKMDAHSKAVDLFMERQDRINAENTRAHEVIAENVNQNKWRVARMERKLGLKTRRDEERERDDD